MTRLVLTNIGTLLSGDVKAPLVKADTIEVENGKIKSIENGVKKNLQNGDSVIDVNGMTVAPGLIDAHYHPTIWDVAPRQTALGNIENCMHGGVTSIISAGIAHLPGTPSDPTGAKATAIFLKKHYENYRPGGVKVHAGTVILEHGLTEGDFKELSEEGVKLVAEIGLGSVKEPTEVKQMVNWARKYGMKVMMHAGGLSSGGSEEASQNTRSYTADDFMNINPDVVSHANGGTTSLSLEDISKLLNSTQLPLDLVYIGNPRTLAETASMVMKLGCPERILVGTDCPAGAGIAPLGVLKTVVMISSLGGVPAETAVGMATGNPARYYGLNTGLIERGREADIIVMDTPVGGAGRDAVGSIEYGDNPGIAMVIIDGVIRTMQSKMTVPTTRRVTVKQQT
jgi:enamidase